MTKTMTKTTLQRIHSLADAKPVPAFKTLASVARKLASEDDAVDKAHTVAGLIKGLSPLRQDSILTAAEALMPVPETPE